MMPPPQKRLPPFASWSTRRRPRPIVHAPKGLQAWALDLPETIEGTGAEEQTHDWMSLAAPYPVGVGLFSCPSASLHLDAGGKLTASIEAGGPGIYHTGSGDPDDGTGCDGDYYLDVESMAWWGPKGDSTADSWDGMGPNNLPDPGEDNEWLFGSGDPGDGQGADGDYYYDAQAAAWWGPKGDSTEHSWADTGPHALPEPEETVVLNSAALIVADTTQEFEIKNLGSAAYATASGYGANGTFYSAWASLAESFDADQRGFLYGGTSYMDATALFLSAPPYEWQCDVTLFYELGHLDAVVESFEIALYTHHVYVSGGAWVRETNIEQTFSPGQSVVLSGQVSQRRTKMVVAGNINCRPTGFCGLSMRVPS